MLFIWPLFLEPKNPSILKLIASGESFLHIATNVSPDDDSCSSTYVQFTCGDQTIKKYLRRSGATHTQVSVKIDNLTPLTNYSCFTVIFNDAGESDPSSVSYFMTKETGELNSELKSK